MFTVIGIMFCGIAVGYFFRKVELLQKIGKPISYTILLLLFLLGISVGANESIVNNLTTLGGQALLIASAGTLGSVLAAWGVYHFFFKEPGMKGSLIVVGFFALGCLLGWSGYLPGVIIENDITVYVLYLLMFQVGISIGSDKKLKDILSSIRPKLLLVPLATIIGTLSFSALISLALTKWSVFDCLAVGSGFAYYSLSSILITELKEPTLGAQLAAELGTIALIANIIREIFALLGAPLFVRYFGRLSPICAGGATTMDTTLPIITRYCGKDLVFVSIFHGILVDFTVPFFVSFFCSM